MWRSQNLNNNIAELFSEQLLMTLDEGCSETLDACVVECTLYSTYLLHTSPIFYELRERGPSLWHNRFKIACQSN